MTTTALEKPQTTLPEPVMRRGVNEAQWRTLCNSLYPGAKAQSVLMVIDYCAARRLDPLKKPCHIVPMEVKTGDGYEWRDVVMPGIYELRTTAQRTGEYIGHAKPEYGPDALHMGVMAPAWCEFTVYRWNSRAQVRSEFPVRVLFAEVVAVTKDRKTQEWKANARWSKAPVQMLTKCAEAAALREAFPDEIGGEHTVEEMEGQSSVVVDVTPAAAKGLSKPDSFDACLDKLKAAADKGEEELGLEWQETPEDVRAYLNASEPATWEGLRATAARMVL